VIPLSDIAHWRHHQAPWTADEQVEQDLVISRALVELFTVPAIASNLAFRGGTALHKLHLSPASRYSEDIDLVQTTPMPIGSVVGAIRARLDPWLDLRKRKPNENMFTLTYRFTSEGPRAEPRRLKVEIYTREAFNVMPHVDFPFDVQSPWFHGTAALRTFALEELLGTKLRALYQRRKGRDVFDLAHALNRVPTLDRQAVVDCFLAYMRRMGPAPTRVQFAANLAEKRQHSGFMSDMHPLLHPSYGRYNPTAALDEIEREFIARLP
jgi:predicted nucleotidyltransferase component of viral defense system